MFGDFEIREIPLSLKTARSKVEAFLLSQGLRPEHLDRYFGIFDTSDNLIGGGGLSGNVVKCIALSQSARSESLTNPLISRIREAASEEGLSDLYLFTKPENRAIFESLAFHTVGTSDKAILMETDPRGIKRYCAELSRIRQSLQDDGSPAGIIVMNCNPLTRGHKYLIETAAGRVGRLFIIPVSEDASEYSYQERLDMLRQATATLPNVSVCPGSNYAVSKATFPTYFLKDLNDASKTQIKLDLDIFATHIAPALGATIRFVGTEPNDKLTSEYNAVMKDTLPARGINVVEIERLSDDSSGRSISASAVRKLILEGKAGAAMKMTPSSSWPYPLAHAACQALRDELDLTPKPGLVDIEDNGSHTDMDHQIMSRSIEALKGPFATIARLGLKPSLPDHNQIREAGIEAETAMMEATGGINTHRGALFSIGLTLIAAANSLFTDGEITEYGLKSRIVRLAEGFGGNKNSHGAEVRLRYGIKGAADIAREGYAELFQTWLPFFREQIAGKETLMRLLLKIMTSLEDTNVYHRAGKQGAEMVKSTAEEILANFSIEALEKANIKFKSANISPGGAADMLSLTLLIHSLTNNKLKNN